MGVTIRSAVDLLSNTFEEVATTMVSLFAAAEYLAPRLDLIEGELRNVELLVPFPGSPHRGRCRSLQTEIDRLRGQLEVDPLTVDADEVSRISSLAARLRSDAETVGAAFTALVPAFEALEADLASLDAEEARLRPVVADVQSRIAGSPVGVDALDRLSLRTAGLRGEVRIVRARYAEADPVASLEALSALRGQVEEVSSELSRIGDETSALMNRRRALRGLLDAYLAKVRVLGQAEDPALEETYAAARAVLYTAPCHLAEAERLVAAYGAAVARAQLADRPREADRSR
jgi:hypothetical protein